MQDKILVTRSSMPEFQEYIDEIRSMWDDHWLTNMGKKHEKLRGELREYLGVDEIELFTNGHMAIELALQAFGLSGEVITTPFTFASTTHAIVRSGLRPVFCDIDPVTYTMDPDRIRERITERTSAILPVHVYGNICQVEEIKKIADEFGLKVIYDAAHAFGVTYRGKGIGSFGDASCFSFHATKVFNTIEGGAVCYSNRENAFGEQVYLMKDFGISREDLVKTIGANAKLNEFCAAMGLCNLRHIDGEIEKRKRVVLRYRERLSGKAGLTLNGFQEEVKTNYAYFPVLFDKEEFGFSRDEAAERLQENGIYARKYFYPPTNAFECYREEYDPKETPSALSISEKVLTLPLYADLSLTDVDRICDIILDMER
ncbi:MAG: DegT/DnrJ/EryC1/StrS family aminotransferase [Lachnospiraceae bacterium]|nr:DegT/DnrJ/EryC1/StrS family aminotransferase [Lachnospiraceae bacterium]